MNGWAERVLGKTDVEVIPPGPGAIHVIVSDVIDDGWDSADATLLVGDIADHERQSVAEITICATPHDNSIYPASVSIELMPAEIDDLVAALLAIKANASLIQRTAD